MSFRKTYSKKYILLKGSEEPIHRIKNSKRQKMFERHNFTVIIGNYAQSANFILQLRQFTLLKKHLINNMITKGKICQFPIFDINKFKEQHQIAQFVNQ
ncbi:MAG: hypothetical protein KDK96_12285, partial [Chlamydiia bacterium]|nr:hypothetical protein [Chlamydiia bacterium]